MKEMLAGVIAAVLSVFGGPQPAGHPAANAAAAAAAVAPIELQVSTTTVATSSISKVDVPASAPAAVVPDLSQYVTKSELDSRLAGLSAFTNSLAQFLTSYRSVVATPASYSLSGPSQPLSVAAFAPSQRIDNLSRVTITNSTIDTASIPDLSGSYLSISSTSTARSTIGLSYASLGEVSNATNVHIATWGDSLTSGVGASSGNDWPSDLQRLTDHEVYNGGVSGETTAQIKQRMVNNVAQAPWPTIIWAGRNDVGGDTSSVEADIAAMVSHLTTSNYIVLSVLNLNTETSGTSNYNWVITLNSYLSTTYGGHYLDVRSYLISNGLSDAGITPTAQDNTDISNGVVPSSLRYDTVHLNDAGYLVVAQYIANHASLLYSTSTPTTSVLTTTNVAAIFSNPQRFSFVDASDGYYIGGTEVLAASSSNGSMSVGFKAAPWMMGTSTPFYSTAIGDHAMFYAPSSGAAVNNTAIGNSALYANKTGNNNTAIGYAALRLNDSGYYNTAVGVSSLFNNSSGYYNGAFGRSALYNNVSGNFNAAFGTNALYTNSTGSYNIAVGDSALRLNTTGSNNVAVGAGALQNNASATSSVAVGDHAAYTTSGYSSSGGVYVGYQSAYNLQNANYNTLLGYRSGFYVTAGSNNIIVGAASGAAATENLTTGSNNIKIGSNISFPSATASYQLNIGNIIYGTNINGSVSTNSTGNIGIATTSPFAKFSIHANNGDTNTTLFAIASSTAAATTTLFSISNQGNVTITGSATTCTLGNGTSATNCSASDQRLKDDIQSLDASTSLAAIRHLNPVSYKWNAWMVGNGAATTSQFGFIAQQVAPVFSSLVTEDPNTHYYKLDYQGFFAPIVGAIQALADKIGDFADAFTTKELTFTRATGDEIDVRTAKAQVLCLGSTCVTESQLQKLLANASSAGSATSVGSTTDAPDVEPPVITINGNNPAHVTVGTSYADLGASVTDNVDQNLGIKTFLNGALVSDIVIDTSAEATNTIDYVATDNAGNTATTTRTVIIEAASATEAATSPEVAPVSDPATTTSQ